MGVDGGKIKIGLNMKDDLRRIGIMNDAFRKVKDRPYLMIDTNEYWSPKQAIRYINQIEKHFDIFWAEEPARRWDFDGLRQVSRNITAAVASGENMNDISQMYPLISQQAIDVAHQFPEAEQKIAHKVALTIGKNYDALIANLSSMR